MKPRFTKTLIATSLVAAGAGGSQLGLAQTEQLVLEEVIVSARRRSENLQDVPISVNVVGAEQLRDLNIRQFDELQGVVAGLTVETDSISPSATLRGVRFDSFSGVTPSVATYLNDAPVSQLTLTQAVFDIDQFEVLRGPQGTIQGLSAPSGAISARTQRPEFNDFSGYIDLTASDTSAYSVRGAVTIPLIDDMLAVRVAGSWEENELSQIKSVTGEQSDYEHEAFRGSLRFEPTDNLQFNLMYQEIKPQRYEWFQVESASLADSSQPTSDVVIRAGDRKAVSDVAEQVDGAYEILVFEASGQFFGQDLKYIYADQDVTTLRTSPNDIGNAVSGQPWDNFPDMQNGAQGLNSFVTVESHELRLSSIEPLFGFMDYSMGYFTIEQVSDNRVNNQSYVAVFLPPGVAAPFAVPVAGLIASTPLAAASADDEESWFANLTFHLSEATELSVGMRDITYEQEGSLSVSGRVINASELEDDETIFSASLKHNFSDDLMAYVSYGESWRKGGTVVGNFSINKSPLQLELENRKPETSDSFEIGMRSDWLDGQLRLNATAFYQEFENYPFRPGEGVNYVNYAFGGFAPSGAPIVNPEVGSFNFVGGVPVEVMGLELESFLQVNDQWWINLLYSYSEGEISGGEIPCNDYFPNDGVPDSVAGTPTIFDIWAVTGGPSGDGLTQCAVDYRSNTAPLWTATLSSEYAFQIAGMESYVRGMWTLYDDSENDPANPLDDVGGYNILNLYAGVRDSEGRWQAQIYAKNVADTEEVIKRGQNPSVVGYTGVNALTQSPDPTLGGVIVSSYRSIQLTPPREIGINITYNF